MAAMVAMVARWWRWWRDGGVGSAMVAMVARWWRWWRDGGDGGAMVAMAARWRRWRRWWGEKSVMQWGRPWGGIAISGMTETFVTPWRHLWRGKDGWDAEAQPMIYRTSGYLQHMDRRCFIS